MSELKIKNLRKAYSRQIVPVKDLDLQVKNGEFLTLVGPSGCGKSTILRLIAGLEQPSSGKVEIGDRDVTALSPGDRNIAMVFQSYALYPHMSVYDNMASGLKLRKLAAGEVQTRIQEASRVLGLDELLDRKPAKLSGGQRQRVALGRALVRDPDVFLLDEPLSNLDALLREQVRADLKQIFQKQKSPVVYVTHDQTEAMTLSSKVAVLNKGLLQQLDTPEVIYTKPANRFVASFIGSPQMNLMTLPCSGNHGLLGNFKIPLPKATRSPQAIGLGIRPEHVRLAQPEENETTVHGQVFLVENLGMSYLLSIRLDGEETTLRALLPSDAHWNNEDLTLALPGDRLHWFDAKTEDRIGNT
ncbi:MAG: ATP-binding cassette domain-containing protein [Leptolyngbyaceae cyanobacterium SL_1_1]|nr:ATP-binding cassette domain-containing protein [Leptolyngbyaceae cyanobacterium RM1_1_2]NJO10046.1 ATP-binding cassette domain-containing protein [Leptolyngbyaceae cyanobacterium SL_1_1]